MRRTKTPPATVPGALQEFVVPSQQEHLLDLMGRLEQDAFVQELDSERPLEGLATSCAMILDTSTWNRETCGPTTTPLAQGCLGCFAMRTIITLAAVTHHVTLNGKPIAVETR